VIERRGWVFIAPDDVPPDESMVDPATSEFGASWQDDHAEIEYAEFVGAETAIAWGRERSDIVLIRLNAYTYFSAGALRRTLKPPWPPARPPGGWWNPGTGRTNQR